MNKFYLSIVGVIVAASSILLFNFLGGISNAALPRDCDNNSIVYCGSVTAGELATKYRENKTHDLPAIYNSYGLSANEMTHAGSYSRMGEVRKDGRVIVGGRTVATDAQSIGRHNMAGSHPKVIGGRTYYESPPSTSFVSQSIAAFVFFDSNGDFKAAVLTSCDNPLSARKPVYRCDSLTKNKITRTRYSFTATATANSGATIVSYTYDFGDGHKTTTTARSAEHTYANPGTYRVKLSVNVSVHGVAKTVSSAHCQVNIVVETLPPTPVYSCDSLVTNRISRTEHNFTGRATARNGATIVNYTFDFGDGSQQTVTNPVNVRHTYVRDATYTTTMTVKVKVSGVDRVVGSNNCKVQVIVSPNECKPGIPVGDDRCKEECKPGIPVGDDRCKEECRPGIPVGDDRCTPCEIPGKEHLPKNSPDCVEVEIPEELPQTGPMDFIGGALGLSSLVGAAYYWYASRRGLLAEFLKQ